MSDEDEPYALLLDLLTHDICGGLFIGIDHLSAVCRCVTTNAIKERESEAVSQAWELLILVRKLHEVAHREPAGRIVELEESELRAACECCGYQTMNDVTFLNDAFEAAGLRR